MEKPIVAVVGAGLVGCLAAIAFEREGYTVRVYESRPDLRDEAQRLLTSARSINLAVSARGIDSLKSIDQKLTDEVLKHILPMRGRMIHDLTGNQTPQDYGLYGETINSIDRAELNRGLLDELDKAANISVFYNHKLVRASFRGEHTKLRFSVTDGSENEAERVVDIDDIAVVIGADGAHSGVRSQLQKVVRMNFNQNYIEHAYLELKIPAAAGNQFVMSNNHLHIWPRHEFMLIALPNDDGSFTCTLFAPWAIFDGLKSEQSILDFFQQQFPDAVGFIGKNAILDSFNHNPVSPLVTVRCSTYNYKGKVIIVGDAAHSMVPFYGQGMNCGFEDVRVLMDILRENNFDFAKSFDQYTNQRHQDLIAIQDLAMLNYEEMRSRVTSQAYLRRKQIDALLSRILKDKWLPLYTMISFRSDISYSEAAQRIQRQNRLVSDALTVLIPGLAFTLGVFVYKRLR